mgnify:CR=1 FL=1
MTEASEIIRNAAVPSTAGAPVRAETGLPRVFGAPKQLGRARLIVGLSGPVGIGVAAALAWVVMHSFALAYAGELAAAALISAAAGVIALLPMLFLMGKGGATIVQMTMVAMLVRMGVTLAGLFLALRPAWHLDPGPLVILTALCYMALMIAESGATIWATRH